MNVRERESRCYYRDANHLRIYQTQNVEARKMFTVTILPLSCWLYVYSQLEKVMVQQQNSY